MFWLSESHHLPIKFQSPRTSWPFFHAHNRALLPLFQRLCEWCHLNPESWTEGWEIPYFSTIFFQGLVVHHSKQNSSSPIFCWVPWVRLQAVSLIMCLSLDLLFSSAPESPGRLVKTQISEPHSRISESIGIRLGSRIFISNKFQSDVDTAGSGNTLWEPLAYNFEAHLFHPMQLMMWWLLVRTLVMTL